MGEGRVSVEVGASGVRRGRSGEKWGPAEEAGCKDGSLEPASQQPPQRRGETGVSERESRLK